MSCAYEVSDDYDDDDDEDELPDYKSMLELQLAEIELLRSMYGDTGELSVDDEEAVEMVRLFVAGDVDYELLEARIGFTLKLQLAQSTVEVVCCYPHAYPACPPNIALRTQLPRHNQHHLTEDLYTYISSQTTCELYVCNLLAWINEHYKEYVGATAVLEKKDKAQSEPITRYWIYSHHIYSKFKRKDILDWARELKLNGFSMPGKPGVVCAEGRVTDVEEYWSRLRRLNWKRLVLKHIEKSVTGRSFRKFTKFEEMMFDARVGRGREYHMDLGKFRAFLEDRGCEEVFGMYFGVEGRSHNT